MQLEYCLASDVQAFGQQQLSQLRDQYQSFEEAAQGFARNIYTTFVQDDGSPAFALVRVFRISPFEDLLPELQAMADRQTDYWVTLMGTFGDEGAWCDRYQSQDHQVFPARADVTPMLKAAFEQMNLSPGQKLGAEDAAVAFQGDEYFKRHFHIENAVDSPSIPAQDFVRRDQIKSVAGIGSPFLSGASYMLLLFARIQISKEAIRKLIELGPYASTLLAIFDGQQALWGQLNQSLV